MNNWRGERWNTSGQVMLYVRVCDILWRYPSEVGNDGDMRGCENERRSDRVSVGRRRWTLRVTYVIGSRDDGRDASIVPQKLSIWFYYLFFSSNCIYFCLKAKLYFSLTSTFFFVHKSTTCVHFMARRITTLNRQLHLIIDLHTPCLLIKNLKLLSTFT